MDQELLGKVVEEGLKVLGTERWPVLAAGALTGAYSLRWAYRLGCWVCRGRPPGDMAQAVLEAIEKTPLDMVDTCVASCWVRFPGELMVNHGCNFNSGEDVQVGGACLGNKITKKERRAIHRAVQRKVEALEKLRREREFSEAIVRLRRGPNPMAGMVAQSDNLPSGLPTNVVKECCQSQRGGE